MSGGAHKPSGHDCVSPGKTWHTGVVLVAVDPHPSSPWQPTSDVHASPSAAGAAVGTAVHSLVPGSQKYPGPQWSVLQLSPNPARCRQVVQLPGVLALQRPEAHCEEYVHGASSASVPAVRHVGVTPACTSGQDSFRSVSKQAKVTPTERVEPGANW